MNAKGNQNGQVEDRIAAIEGGLALVLKALNVSAPAPAKGAPVKAAKPAKPTWQTVKTAKTFKHDGATYVPAIATFKGERYLSIARQNAKGFWERHAYPLDGVLVALGNLDALPKRGRAQ